MSIDDIEFLVRRNAKGIDPAGVSRSTNIVIDMAHLNAACEGISDLAMAMIDAHVCGDINQLKRLHRPAYRVCSQGRVRKTDGLFNQILTQVLILAEEKQWGATDKGRDRIRTLAHIAIDDIVDSPVCRTCGGTRFVQLTKPCSACKGTGRKRLNIRQVSKLLGVDETTWRRTWHSRYTDIASMLQAIIGDAARKIRFKTFFNS